MKLKFEYINDGTSFRAIDPLSINPEYLTDFSIYDRQKIKEDTYKFRCLLVDSSSMAKERLMELLKSWGTVYIHENQVANYNQYVRNNLEYILKHDEINVLNKTNTLVDLSTQVVTDFFDTNFASGQACRKNLENVQNLITQAIGFISDINSLNGIASLIGHDYETHSHSIKVGWLMATFINSNKDLFGVQSGPDLKKLLIEAAVSGLLHDIGKVKIPPHILNKNGKLNNMEYIVIQSHTAYSASLLFDKGLSNTAMRAILYHHENEDGSGYPSGLKHDEIPLISKLCHIADVFDALTSRRHYKEPKTPFDALKIMAGQNPYLDTLKKFEKEVTQNRKIPLTAIVRDDYNVKLRRLREKEIIEEEAQKRVEARIKLRDQGMAHCFDKDLLRLFIHTISKSESFQLSELL